MLESKQLELSRHLKELSQKNDQAISDILRRYDLDKSKSINQEKGKMKDGADDHDGVHEEFRNFFINALLDVHGCINSLASDSTTFTRVKLLHDFHETFL